MGLVCDVCLLKAMKIMAKVLHFGWMEINTQVREDMKLKVLNVQVNKVKVEVFVVRNLTVTVLGFKIYNTKT